MMEMLATAEQFGIIFGMAAADDRTGIIIGCLMAILAFTIVIAS